MKISTSELDQSKVIFADQIISLLDYIKEQFLAELSDVHLAEIIPLSNRLYEFSLGKSTLNESLELLDDIESFLTSSNLSFWSDELLAISDMRLLLNSGIQKVEEKLSISQDRRAIFHSLTKDVEIPSKYLTLRPGELAFLRSYLKTKMENKEDNVSSFSS